LGEIVVVDFDLHLDLVKKRLFRFIRFIPFNFWLDLIFLAVKHRFVVQPALSLSSSCWKLISLHIEFFSICSSHQASFGGATCFIVCRCFHAITIVFRV